MKKTTKSLIALAGAALVMSALLAVYVWQSGRVQPEDEAEQPEELSVVLVDRKESDIESVSFTSNGRTFTLKSEPFAGIEDSVIWIYADDPDFPVNDYNVINMVRAFHNLVADERFLTEVDDPAEYGLDPAEAVVVGKYRDGTFMTLYVGNKTPDREQMYFMVSGDDSLYLMPAYLGERYTFDEDYFIDKYLPELTLTEIKHVYVNQKGRPLLECLYRGTEEDLMALYEEYNAISIFMLSPLLNRELYYTSFQTNVLINFDYFYFGELIEMYPEDLSVYGLHEPVLEVILEDFDNRIHLLFGYEADGDTIYSKHADKPYVFKTSYHYIKDFFDIDAFQLVARHTALHDIRDCKNVTVDYAGDPPWKCDITIVFIRDQEANDGTGDMTAVVNGRLFPDRQVRVFYRNLLSIVYDRDIPVFVPAEPPVFTVSFEMSDGNIHTYKYFTYDANFYAVQEGDDPIIFVTNRIAVEYMLSLALELTQD
ncbi:MAG: DUF4340 domain-containing protein [Defluviitaleaceae bacterium]|nr:DUF4340 domain-containing protein [Defluviitaleaceae bacterium]